MPERMNPISYTNLHDSATSPGASRPLDLEIRPAPAEPENALPESYGLPQFGLLAVDPQYVFVFWEIPPSQLAQFEQRVTADEFTARRLVVRLLDIDDSGRPAATQELYGEQGRWFLAHGLPGRRVKAELGFNCAGRFERLGTAGPLLLPRNFVIEASRYEELTVNYATGPAGELQISRVTTGRYTSWPHPLPPLPAPLHLGRDAVASRQPGSPGYHWPDLPSSPMGNPGSCTGEPGGAPGDDQGRNT